MSDNAKIADPICPKCDIKGLDYIVSRKSVEQSRGGDAWFNIVQCSQCGHVYGVFNKVSLKPTVNIPSMGSF